MREPEACAFRITFFPQIGSDLPFSTAEEEAEYVRKYGYERVRPASPRNVDSNGLSGFGAAMAQASKDRRQTVSRINSDFPNIIVLFNYPAV